MERNFFRRVEIAFPVREQTHRNRILRDLNLYLADNAQAWTLGRDGRYGALRAWHCCGEQRTGRLACALCGGQRADRRAVIAPATSR